MVCSRKQKTRRFQRDNTVNTTAAVNTPEKVMPTAVAAAKNIRLTKDSKAYDTHSHRPNTTYERQNIIIIMVRIRVDLQLTCSYSYTETLQQRNIAVC